MCTPQASRLFCRRDGQTPNELIMSTRLGFVSVLMVVIVMALAMFAVPFAGSLIFVAAIGAGAAVASWRSGVLETCHATERATHQARPCG